MITYAQKAKGANNNNPAKGGQQQVQQQLLQRQQQQSAAQQINARSQQQMSGQPRFQMTQLIPTSMPGLYSQYPYNYAIQQQQQQPVQRSNYPYPQQQQRRSSDQYNYNAVQSQSSYRGRTGRTNRYNGYSMSKPSYSSRSHSSHSQQPISNQNQTKNPNQNQSSYESRGGRSYRRDNAYHHGRNKQPRGKPTAAQLRTYQTVADRDVLCWIFENHGRCRYGEKCQWLHLDRVTGQYVPTVYIMNSMDTSYTSSKPKEDDGATQTTSGDNKEDEVDTKEEPANGPEADTNPSKQEPEQDTVELAEKFKKMMAKQIEDRIKEEKEKKAAKEKEEEKKEKEEEEKQEVEETKEEEVEVEVEVDKETVSDPATKYASYGTTFDKQNVCWEFNTFVGCRKGSSCKWAHQYLMKGATHPYTGEKLDGMAVKEFRKKNNI